MCAESVVPTPMDSSVEESNPIFAFVLFGLDPSEAGNEAKGDMQAESRKHTDAEGG